jgi:hypothetical protein
MAHDHTRNTQHAQHIKHGHTNEHSHTDRQHINTLARMHVQEHIFYTE